MRFTLWRKNWEPMRSTGTQRFLKLQDYHSSTPLCTKRGTLIGLFHSVLENCNEPTAIYESAVKCIVEAKYLLHYPSRVLTDAISTVGFKRESEPLLSTIPISEMA